MSKSEKTQQVTQVQETRAISTRDAHTNQSPASTVVYHPAPDAATPTAPAGRYSELKIKR